MRLKFIVQDFILQPLFPSEIKNQANADGRHECPKVIIPIMPVQFRHVVEVHAIDPHQEREGHEDGGDDGEHPHHVVGAET